ncbi:MAG TPA: DUF3373 domain-containing protein [Geobacteraceae bacterium]
MKRITRNFVSASLLLGMALPVSAMAADQDLEQKIDNLNKEIEGLKRDVGQTKQKSMGQWLTIGGDYRIRLDSLRGRTAAYTDAIGSITNAQNALQGTIFTGGSVTGQPLSTFIPLMQTIQNTTSYSAANALVNSLGTVPPGGPSLIQQMAGQLMTPQSLGGFAKQVQATTVANDTMYTNRFGLNLSVKPTEDVSVHARLLMYKVTGSQDDSAITGTGTGPFFADRVGVFDATVAHVPSDNKLAVDTAYATWKNVFGQPIWFSVGRRPSAGGIPSTVKQNRPGPGQAGTPALMIDFAFDGGTLGIAPDIEALPGAYAKFCWGRGFDSGIVDKNAPHLHDTEFVGIAVIPIDTDPLRIDFQWDHGYNLFDFPVMKNTAFGDTAPSVQLGGIDWYELGAISTLKNIGPGTLNVFGTAGLSVTHPNDNVSGNAGFEGLLTGQFFKPEAPTDKTGWGAWIGARYDVTATRTKIGAEYNHGSKNWITTVPSADDLWTSKVGTRGNVYEGYIIQELPLKPISSYLSKAFFRLGYQYYDFEYTGSNNWVGAPVKIADIKPTDMMLLTPLKSATDLYLTFEVHF